MLKNELVIRLEAAERGVLDKQAEYDAALKETPVDLRKFFTPRCYLESNKFSALPNKPKAAYIALQVALSIQEYAVEEHRIYYDRALEIQAQAQNEFQVALDKLAQANLEVTSLKVSHASD